jgi:PAS domain S-box-containing protein
MYNFTEQRIRHILSSSPAIIYTCRVDRDFGVTFVSENVTTLLGYTVKECLDNQNFWKENLHPDDRDRVLENYPSFYGIERYAHEYRFRKKDGGYLWISDEMRVTHDSEGNPVEIIGYWVDITHRKETEDALRKSEALFRDFFLTNPVATIVTSLAGTIHMVNPEFMRKSGYSEEELVGRTSQEVGFWRNPADRDRMVSNIKECGYIDKLESFFYGKNNLPMTCLVSSRVVEFEGESRILSVVVDVTDQRRAEEGLRKLDQAKSDFISTAAHELRTPLIAIIGYSELLENVADIPLTEEQKESYLSIVKSNADSLALLVDDLLDVGRIQVGRSLGVVRKEIDLSAIIEKAVESFSVRSRHHSIVVVHDNVTPETLWIDGVRINQVLNNLLANAIKYSPQGGIIKIKTVTDEDKVTVSIVDQGMGMSAEQIEHVFDRFYRGESEKAETSGLGLGMSIVKQIIADHGGEIFVSSHLGAGTTVAFTLPTRRPG